MRLQSSTGFGNWRGYWLLAMVASMAFAAGLASEGRAQDTRPEAGVTDLTTADADAIETRDIIDALAVSRGTRIEAGAPPTVRLPVYFEFNSTQLRPEAVALLEKVSGALSSEELSSFRFSVEGHTDSIGSDPYNLGLSTRRAAAVTGFLTANGVPQERLGPVGRGESDPVASNETDDGRQRNRRVELINLGAR